MDSPFLHGCAFLNPVFLNYLQFKDNLSFVGKEGLVRDHEAYVLYRIAGTLPPRATALEIGCWKGKSSIAICWGLAQVDGHLHTVDNFDGVENNASLGQGAEVMQAFERNVAKANATAQCTLHNRPSQAFAAEWNQELDFLFVDGCHFYDAARFDIFAFTKFVKPGGWVAFHDIRMRESVIRAIREYLDQDKTWAMEDFAWDNNLLALKRASDSATAKPRWYLNLILTLAPLTCLGIPSSSQFFQKYRVKLMQSFSRFIFRRMSLINGAG
jgi:predicted O-methyltransferase YrrM